MKEEDDDGEERRRGGTEAKEKNNKQHISDSNSSEKETAQASNFDYATLFEGLDTKSEPEPVVLGVTPGQKNMNDAHSLVRKGTMALLLGESSGPKSVDALELENNEGTKLLLHSDKALQPAESAEMLVEKLSGESKMKGNVVANDSREEPSNSLQERVLCLSFLEVRRSLLKC